MPFQKQPFVQLALRGKSEMLPDQGEDRANLRQTGEAICVHDVDIKFCYPTSHIQKMSGPNPDFDGDILCLMGEKIVVSKTKRGFKRNRTIVLVRHDYYEYVYGK